MNIHDMKRRVRDTALKAYEEKLVAGTSGNVSEYDRDADLMAITPTGMDYRILPPEDVVIMKTDGTVLEGGKPSSEWRLHAQIYLGLKRAAAVIHTHSPRATSFAVLHEIIPVILIEMIPFLGGDIPLSNFGVPGTDEVGTNAVKVMRNRHACLMANHGVVALGKDLPEAYIRAVYVEDAATIYHNARQIGSPKIIDEETIAVMRKKFGVE